MTKRVFFIAPSAYTLGGIQTWLDYMGPGTTAYGWEATIVLTSGKYHNVKKYLDVHNIERSISLENPTGTIQGRISAIEDLIVANQPDLIVVLNIVDVYQAVNNLRKRNIQTPRVIASMHGIHPGLIGDFKNYRSVIDAVISSNRLAQKLVTDKGMIDPSRSLYAPYGVEVNEQSTRSLENGKFKVAYVGRIEEDQKRFSDVLKIFSQILNKYSDTEILVAGDGEEAESFLSWVNELENSEQVHYLGVLDADALNREVYSRTNVLLLTSHWETGPIVAWEAISKGALVVSSRYIGHKEEGSLVDGENCMLFDIGDIEAAVAKIELARDPVHSKKLSKNAASMVQNKYTTSKSIATWVECFEEVVARPVRSYSSASQQQVLDKGKLSGLFGQQLAEKLRKLLGISFEHSGPGGEWPHSYSGIPSESRHLSRYVESSDGKTN